MKRAVYFFLSIILLISSCEIEDENNQGKTCKISKKYYDNGSVVEFVYQDDGKLKEITDERTNSKAVIEYDNSGRIIKFSYLLLSGDSVVSYTTYNWIDAKNVEAETYFYNYNGEAVLNGKTKYELNDNGDPVKQSFYEKDDEGNWYIDSYNIITWEEDNMTEVDSYNLDIETGEFYNSMITTYNYDINPNPLRNMSIRSVVDDFENFPTSAHNPVSSMSTMIETGSSVTTSWSYEYDTDGKPISYVRKKANGLTGVVFDTQTVEKIEYECK
jgi:hypothetical protein